MFLQLFFFQFSKGRILNVQITACLKNVKKTLVLILLWIKVLDDQGVHCVLNVIFPEAKTISNVHTYTENITQKRFIFLSSLNPFYLLSIILKFNGNIVKHPYDLTNITTLG